MPFPITYNGKVDFKGDAIAELTPDILLEQLEAGLKKAKATNVFRNAMTLSFSGGIRSLVTNWSLLTAISSGKIQIESTDKTISVIYRLRFTGILIFATLLVALMWEPVRGHFEGSIPQSLLALLVMWTFLFGGNYLWAVATFSSFLRKEAKSTRTGDERNSKING